MLTLTTTWAHAFQEQGKIEEAIDAYKKAIFIKPDYADAYCNLHVSSESRSRGKKIDQKRAL